MSVLANGVSTGKGSGSYGRVELTRPETITPRLPRRLLLLADGEASDLVRVLAEYSGAEVSGKRLHDDLQRLAAEHPGHCVAAEWKGPLGWTRFLWCRK